MFAGGRVGHVHHDALGGVDRDGDTPSVAAGQDHPHFGHREHLALDDREQSQIVDGVQLEAAGHARRQRHRTPIDLAAGLEAVRDERLGVSQDVQVP